MRKKILEELKLCTLMLMVAVGSIGCGKKNTKKTYDGKFYAEIINEINENGNTIVGPSYIDEMYEIKKLYENYLGEYIDLNGLKSFDTKVNPVEFGEYTTTNNPTYEMAIGTIDQNNNLDSKTKEYLKIATDRIHTAFPNINLAPFVYNMTDLKVEYTDSKDYSAKFNPYKKTIYKSKYAKEDAILDVIGLCYTNAYTVCGDENVLCTNVNPYLNIGYTYYKDEVCEIGKKYEDGLAGILSTIASGKKIDSKENLERANNAFRLLLTLGFNDITIDEYVNKGIDGLLDTTCTNGHNEMIKYIFSMDTKVEGIEDNTKIDGLYSMFNIYALKLYRDGYSKEEVKEKCKETVSSYYDYIIPDKDIGIFDAPTPTSLMIYIEYEIDNRFDIIDVSKLSDSEIVIYADFSAKHYIKEHKKVA